MKQKVTSSESPFPYIPMTSLTDGVSQRVADDLYCLPIQIVNVCFIGNPHMEKEWVLVDTGMPKSAEHIYDFLSDSFGKVTAPRAILLTHGHFDHVGTVVELAETWDVPVYAHEAELPFLTGEADYPEPDGSVEGGLIAKLSPLFPNEGINLSSRIKALPQDGSIPFLADWKWIHTPGHSPGHVSFFREQDRALIAGDAFVTVRQDSLYKVLTQTIEISGPPRYLTTDWPAAWESVRKLAALEPSVAVTGHGLPMFGADLRDQLGQLVEHFAERAIPDHGRYVDNELH
ncbi:MBL fold metallo-hydrolase [Alkalihalobacillus oceani]|uniref:MBL fold metallo-hydrolase n=1 Tax=Halalkalibacter oceani TaxID=1653776 RepID=UPI00203F3555|nr:MBL fold metallo-hydrolase [Halalkalibacter oceani]MCM3760323.1 MBL fold metallo-hydrolase [Halalkalibacter oceani]